MTDGTRPGSTAKLGILRNRSEKAVSVAVAKMPNETVAQNERSKGNSEGGASLGLTIVPADTVAGQGSRGVVVTDVNPDGPAAESGIRTGDVILDVSGKAVDKPSEVCQAVADARSAGKRTILMRVESRAQCISWQSPTRAEGSGALRLRSGNYDAGLSELICLGAATPGPVAGLVAGTPRQYWARRGLAPSIKFLFSRKTFPDTPLEISAKRPIGQQLTQ